MNDPTFSLAVLNPGGRDADQDFPDGAGLPDDKIHAPVNYHGYAAGAGGSFLNSVEAVQKRGLKNVILLLRSDLKTSFAVLQKLQAQGCRVFVSFKESGLHQVAETLSIARNSSLLTKICQAADGALSSTEDLVTIYEAAGAKTVAFIPTPYPVEDRPWDFSIPMSERRGIYVGTREFDVPSRNHALALSVAFSLSQPVTVVNEKGRAGRRRIEALVPTQSPIELEIIEGRRSYPDYLRKMASHRIVWQWDMSAVPGQVAGDALLCGLPCVGGNGTTERLAFPGLCGHGHNLSEARDTAKRLLVDDAFYAAEWQNCLTKAQQKLSLGVVKEQLIQLFAKP